MTLNCKKALLFVAFLIFILTTNAQTREYRSKCEIMSAFINSDSVINFFDLDNKYSGTTLILVDIFNAFEKCSIDKWGNNKLIILNKGPLVDSLKRMDVYYVLKKRCGYFVFLESKPGKDDDFSIIEGCSNYICSVKNIKQKKLIYLGKIKKGVL
jgi:hypothetical protein